MKRYIIKKEAGEGLNYAGKFGDLRCGHVFNGNAIANLELEDLVLLRPDLFVEVCSGCVPEIIIH